MYSFLVLGLVPGTNITITFRAWLVMLAVLPVIIFLLRFRLKRLAQWSNSLVPRQPISANQLHQQVQ